MSYGASLHDAYWQVGRYLARIIKGEQAAELAQRLRLLVQQHVKPALALLDLLDYSARHIYNRGYLTRVQTIHFARWVFLDDRRRLFFASNYDGSVESYMDDFINKVAWGINLVFSNGIGYPRTNWLILDGAGNEQKYKRVLRRHELPTDVWYKAYPGLTVVDLERNSRIREGIERPSMTDREAREWLRLL